MKIQLFLFCFFGLLAFQTLKPNPACKMTLSNIKKFLTRYGDTVIIVIKKTKKIFFLGILKKINKNTELIIKIAINSRRVSISSPAIKEKIITDDKPLFFTILKK